MASEEQVSANRRSATKSTGLKADHGKTAALSMKIKRPDERDLPSLQTLETKWGVQCIVLVQAFVQEIVGEWKGWLTGSLPMASIAVTSLVNPEWIHFPLWTWVLLIFVVGLLLAMFRVYRDLRNQRDVLQQSLDRLDIAGSFMLVPVSGHADALRKALQKGLNHDV